MSYTQEQLKEATLITNSQYCELDNPTFEGQTKVNSEGKYKMYWSESGNLYYTENTL